MDFFKGPVFDNFRFRGPYLSLIPSFKCKIKIKTTQVFSQFKGVTMLDLGSAFGNSPHFETLKFLVGSIQPLTWT